MYLYSPYRGVLPPGYFHSTHSRIEILIRTHSNQQIDVSFSYVCPVIGNEFRHITVKVAVDPRGDSRVNLQTSLTML